MLKLVEPWQSVHDIVKGSAINAPALPVFCLYPDIIRQLAGELVRELPTPFYAVKANSLPTVLSLLGAAGVRRFDVASVKEVEAVIEAVPNAVCAYMNPVRQWSDIAKAYSLGVRTFALDSLDELEKIRGATGGARDCQLLVRLALAPKDAVYDMSGKFGARYEEGVALLRRIGSMGVAAGLTFHVGSQCEKPKAFSEAMAEAAAVARGAQVALSVVDAGGGFPARYRGGEPDAAAFARELREAFAEHRDAYGHDCKLQTEPGRALVAAGGSVLVRVELRRGRHLYVNDGIHGLLSELRWMPAFHPVRRVGVCAREAAPELMDFSFAGASCDSGDFMKGPYRLPPDMGLGDWIEVGFLGAYCVELATAFNGLGDFRVETVLGDTPWAVLPQHGRQRLTVETT